MCMCVTKEVLKLVFTKLIETSNTVVRALKCLKMGTANISLLVISMVCRQHLKHIYCKNRSSCASIYRIYFMLFCKE